MYNQQPVPMPGMFIQPRPLFRVPMLPPPTRLMVPQLTSVVVRHPPMMIPQPSRVIVQEHHHHHPPPPVPEPVVIPPPPPAVPLTTTEITETIRTVRRRRPRAVEKQTIVEQVKPAAQVSISTINRLETFTCFNLDNSN